MQRVLTMNVAASDNEMRFLQEAPTTPQINDISSKQPKSRGRKPFSSPPLYLIRSNPR